MNFDLNEDQQAILEAVERLLEQHAGPSRYIELHPNGDYDMPLHNALVESGFADICRDESMTGLEAALIVETVAGAAGVVSIGAQAMVAPGVSEQIIDGPIAIVSALDTKILQGPIRYAAHAKHLLVLDKDQARLVEVKPGDIETVRSNFGYPMGRLGGRLKSELVGGTSLGPGSAERLQSWWRLALAVEAVGTMAAALNHTVEYLKQRRQFGRAIGSFQAVQHRLSLCAIQVEASRWLAREAAYKNAEPESAAIAAAFALNAADQVFSETHQLSGAIGFTREFDLHVWTMRLQALRLEFDGVAGHRRAIVETRWGAGQKAGNAKQEANA